MPTYPRIFKLVTHGSTCMSSLICYLNCVVDVRVVAQQEYWRQSVSMYIVEGTFGFID